MWESDLRGTELLMAIAIADHADHDGRCFPGISTLAQKTKLQKRQVQDIIRRLEAKRIFRIETGSGRGHKTIFQFQKVQDSASFNESEKMQESAPFSEAEKMQDTAPLTDEKGCSFAQEKGAGFCTEKVQVSASPYNVEPSLEPLLEPEGRRPATRPPRKPRDERADHPAIAAIRTVTERYPPRTLWDTLIAKIGDEPDARQLQACWIAWISRGYNPQSLIWALEWYHTGIPKRAGAQPAPRFDPGRFDPSPDDIPDAPVIQSEPLRPRPDVPAEQRRIWDGFLDHLRQRYSPDVLSSWFGNIVFDGLNDERRALRLRGIPVAVEWIQRYYIAQMHEILGEMGMGEFTFEWTAEGEETEVLTA